MGCCQANPDQHEDHLSATIEYDQNKQLNSVSSKTKNNTKKQPKIKNNNNNDNNDNNVTITHDMDGMNDTNDINDDKNKATNKKIEQIMKKDHKKDRTTIKLLLLGAGSSGKSTLFRQIESIHGNQNQNASLRYFCSSQTAKNDIFANCITSTIQLLKNSDKLSKDPYNYSECAIDLSVKETCRAIQTVSKASKKIHVDNAFDEKTYDKLDKLGKSVDLIWNLDGIQETYSKRQYFSIIENIHHFLNKITLIMNNSNFYEPNMNDIILSRIRTTGIIERKYLIDDTQFNMYDVGGQRNERRKWISLFDNVNAVIFVVALNGYCSVIFEDETVNKMSESISLFDETCNASHFTSQITQFIMFLNKNDLFIERLKANMKLSICFGDKWNGSNYGDKLDSDFIDDDEQESWFNECYNESIQFIKKAFYSVNRNPKLKSIYTHVTTATDHNNVEVVFNDVRRGIIHRNLAKMGAATLPSNLF